MIAGFVTQHNARGEGALFHRSRLCRGCQSPHSRKRHYVVGIINLVVAVSGAGSDEELVADLICGIKKCGKAARRCARSAQADPSGGGRVIIDEGLPFILVGEIEHTRRPLQGAARLGREQNFFAEGFVLHRNADLKNGCCRVIKILRNIDVFGAVLGIACKVGETEIDFERCLISI